VFIVVVAGGPRLGDLESGAVAAAVTPRFAVVSGGLACVVGIGLLALLVPAFLRYDARTAAARRAVLDEGPFPSGNTAPSGNTGPSERTRPSENT
jgi:hypothetical protein